MEIVISSSSGKAIYEQITSQIKAKVMNGELQNGDALPGIRSLAKELHISVITVQHAYEELQRDGFIETVAGKGTFVSLKNRDFVREEQLREIERRLEEAADRAKTAGIGLDTLVRSLSLYFEED